MKRSITLLIFILFIIAIIYYVNPWNIKERLADSLTKVDLLSDEMKNRLASILLTPQERRIRLINDLENKLDSLKNVVGVENDSEAESENEAITIISEVESIVEKIKENNEDPGIVNTATTKIIEEIKEEVKQAITSENSNQSSSSNPEPHEHEEACKCSEN